MVLLDFFFFLRVDFLAHIFYSLNTLLPFLKKEKFKTFSVSVILVGLLYFTFCLTAYSEIFFGFSNRLYKLSYE
jgi:hypothetical protein